MPIDNETRVQKRTMGKNAARALAVASIWISAAAIAVAVLLTQHDSELIKNLLENVVLFAFLGCVAVSWII